MTPSRLHLPAAMPLSAEHPNLHPSIIKNLEQSDRDGGVFLRDLAHGDVIEVQTHNTLYRIEKRGDNTFTIEGSVRFCPRPTPVRISGSTWGGSMLKGGFVGKGMRLEFGTDAHPNILSSTIKNVRVVAKAEATHAE